MREEGIVVTLNGELATVKGERKALCEGCSSNKICFSGSQKNEVLIEAKNRVNARIGDKVVVEVPTSLYMKSHLFAYLLPITALLIGGAFGVFVSHFTHFPGEDLLSVLFAVLFFSFSLLWLYGVNKRGHEDKSWSPHIVSIIR